MQSEEQVASHFGQLPTIVTELPQPNEDMRRYSRKRVVYFGEPDDRPSGSIKNCMESTRAIGQPQTSDDAAGTVPARGSVAANQTQVLCKAKENASMSLIPMKLRNESNSAPSTPRLAPTKLQQIRSCSPLRRTSSDGVEDVELLAENIPSTDCRESAGEETSSQV
ncbi:unnamed protein product [Cylicostephanus goldi]|uniref:Uncharacterized protein n=1 Tax=Cylicostephanus goldi TaxID=71465 RepID=A0A3P6QZM3_CYLGO|nr:unnamed protein product [Cylicostephanus goldi]